MKDPTYWAMRHRSTGQWYVTTNSSGAPVNGYACIRARCSELPYARLVAQALGPDYQLVRVSNAKAKIARLEADLAHLKLACSHWEAASVLWAELAAKVAK